MLTEKGKRFPCSTRGGPSGEEVGQMPKAEVLARFAADRRVHTRCSCS